MAHAYSHLFIREQGVSSSGFNYLVPPAKRAIVRCVTLYSAESVFGGNIHVIEQTSNVTFIRADLAITHPTNLIYDVRIVLNEGDVLRVFTDGSHWDVSISGYLLSA